MCTVHYVTEHFKILVNFILKGVTEHWNAFKMSSSVRLIEVYTALFFPSPEMFLLIISHHVFSWTKFVRLCHSKFWNPSFLTLLHWDSIELQHMHTHSLYWAVNSASGNPIPAPQVNLSQLSNSVIFLGLCRSVFHTHCSLGTIIFVICSSCIVDTFKKRNYFWITVCSFSCQDGWHQGGYIEGEEGRH